MRIVTDHMLITVQVKNAGAQPDSDFSTDIRASAERYSEEAYGNNRDIEFQPSPFNDDMAGSLAKIIAKYLIDHGATKVDIITGPTKGYLRETPFGVRKS